MRNPFKADEIPLDAAGMAPEVDLSGVPSETILSYAVQEISQKDLSRFLKRFPRKEILDTLFRSIRPPRQSRTTEIQELSLLAGLKEESVLEYFENRKFDYLTNSSFYAKNYA